MTHEQPSSADSDNLARVVSQELEAGLKHLEAHPVPAQITHEQRQEAIRALKEKYDASRLRGEDWATRIGPPPPEH